MIQEGKTPTIPQEALQHFRRAIESLGDPNREVEVSGRLAHVRHAGRPLGRLTYRGELTWDFAIYQCPRQSYSTYETIPSQGAVADLVDRAMDAYNVVEPKRVAHLSSIDTKSDGRITNFPSGKSQNISDPQTPSWP